MRKTTGLAAFLLSSVALASTALAADPVPPPVVIAPEPPPPPVTDLAGYVDAHYGMRFLNEREFDEEGVLDEEFEWRELALGGAGRAVWSISPTFALQLDAWFNLWQEKLEPDEEGEVFTDNWGEGGVGTHLVFGTADGFRGGALVSVGRNGWGTWTNLAGEVAQTIGNFRVSAQGGFTLGIVGEPKEDGERAVYITANATFYPSPNLALTGHIGWDRWYEVDDGFDNDRENTLTLGARAEFQIGTSPLSVYAGYNFHKWHGVDGEEEGDGDTWEGRSHTVFVGVRMLLGRETLQDLDNAVPFADYNPMYGDPFAHR